MLSREQPPWLRLGERAGLAPLEIQWYGVPWDFGEPFRLPWPSGSLQCGLRIHFSALSWRSFNADFGWKCRTPWKGAAFPVSKMYLFLCPHSPALLFKGRDFETRTIQIDPLNSKQINVIKKHLQMLLVARLVTCKHRDGKGMPISISLRRDDALFSHVRHRKP